VSIISSTNMRTWRSNFSTNSVKYLGPSEMTYFAKGRPSMIKINNSFMESKMWQTQTDR
jgi:hypothetical protein